MKAEQKEQLYQVLKKSSAAILGYTAKEFEGAPQFADDIEAPSQALSSAQTSAQSSAPNEQTQEAVSLASGGATIESIAQKIAACARCPLSKTRKNVVPGEGAANPLVLVVGEGPGADEDEQGRPFVGKAGQLLDKMLAAINLSRDKNCFIANIVKCRPPMNRDPAPEESQACRSFLDAQIHVLKPKMILALGRVALQNLLTSR